MKNGDEIIQKIRDVAKKDNVNKVENDFTGNCTEGPLEKHAYPKKETLDNNNTKNKKIIEENNIHTKRWAHPKIEEKQNIFVNKKGPNITNDDNIITEENNNIRNKKSLKFKKLFEAYIRLPLMKWINNQRGAYPQYEE